MLGIASSVSATSVSFSAAFVDYSDVLSAAFGATSNVIGKDLIGCLVVDTFSDSTSKPLGARWCRSRCFSAATSLTFASWMCISTGVLAVAMCLNLQPPAPESFQLPLAKFL